MSLLAILAITGAVLIALTATFVLITISLQVEDRRTKSILGPPPGHLAAASRRVTGLYVRNPVIPCGPACHCHPQTRAALDAHHTRR